MASVAQGHLLYVSRWARCTCRDSAGLPSPAPPAGVLETIESSSLLRNLGLRVRTRRANCEVHCNIGMLCGHTTSNEADKVLSDKPTVQSEAAYVAQLQLQATPLALYHFQQQFAGTSFMLGPTCFMIT